ncbi:MAG TPA: acyl-CoA synthetase [Pseudomonadales bacterium]|nr:acyl-CoA synthetase [Pseudomonadales bacterium]HNN36245.1 acyl-CoA synthetase [Pseudomonadales bacterium]
MMTLHNFWHWAEQTPARTAVIGPDGRQLTFAELDARVNQLSHGLRALGYRRGDAVAVVIPNGIEWLEIFLATLQSGLYMVALNHHLVGAELAYIIDNCDARGLIGHRRYGEALAAAVESLDFDPAQRFGIGGLPGFHDYESLLAGQPITPPAERSCGALMLYTSGTTGKPKGVRRKLPEESPEEVAFKSSFLCLLFNGSVGSGSHLVQGPLYHSGPSGFGMAALQAGQSLVIMDKWTAEAVLALIDRHRITATHLVPTHFERLLDLPEAVRARHDLSCLTHVVHAAAPCPVGSKQRMIDWWGPVIHELYGATEGGGTSCSSQEWLQRPGTVGKAWPVSQVKILDESGCELPAGTPGLIYMSTAIAQFEYHKDSEKTQRSRRGELFTTGDIGYLDEEGYLFLCDRQSDMVISGGVNIYPAEIEGALLQHPKVRDVAVFGVPDPQWGEAIKAVIEVSDGAEPGERLTDELKQFLEGRLARYKWPKSFDYVSTLPRTETGKLMKRTLREPYWAGLERKV